MRSRAACQALDLAIGSVNRDSHASGLSEASGVHRSIGVDDHPVSSIGLTRDWVHRFEVGLREVAMTDRRRGRSDPA